MNIRTLFAIAFLTFTVNAFHEDNGCSFLDKIADDPDVRCAYLSVPEDHDRPAGKKIRIAYAIIKSKAAKAANDPMIFFSGGPGGGSLNPGFIGFMKSSPIAKTRDIIVFDQRGIQHSSPLPDIGKGVFDAMAADTDLKGERKMVAAALSKIKAKAKKEGIDLGNYNTGQNARDVGMLMKSLGYKKYNLFGISYGTRLARTIQDLYPSMLNAVVLDSPNLMTEDFLIDRMRSFSAAAGKVIKFCASDEECSKAHPDLEAEYVKSIRMFEKDPLVIELDKGNFVINPQDAIYFLRRQLYGNDSRTRFPNFVSALIKRDKEVVRKAVETELDDVIGGGFNSSMFLAVSAFESMDPSNSAEKIDKLYNELAYFPVGFGFFTSLYLEGMNWHGKRLPNKDRKFKVSTVPTIIFVNQYDPVTPPENGKLFQKQLGSSHLFILDLGGHSGGDFVCKMTVMAEFMDDPSATPDSSCLKLFSQKGS